MLFCDLNKYDGIAVFLNHSLQFSNSSDISTKIKCGTPFLAKVILVFFSRNRLVCIVHHGISLLLQSHGLLFIHTLG